jgi:hypothetical protein
MVAGYKPDILPQRAADECKQAPSRRVPEPVQEAELQTDRTGSMWHSRLPNTPVETVQEALRNLRMDWIGTEKQPQHSRQGHAPVARRAMQRTLLVHTLE